LGQIRTISAMESHEERIQAEIAREKEKEAKEEIKRKAKQIDMRKRDEAKRSSVTGYSGGGYGNSSGGSGNYGGSSMGFTPNNSGGFPQTPSYPSNNSYTAATYNAPRYLDSDSALHWQQLLRLREGVCSSGARQRTMHSWKP
jgi:coatomer subunit delta